MIIHEMHYNWTPKDEGYWLTATVGYDHVLEIQEHRAQGEGDRWYYDIIYDNGVIERIFNPNRVFFKEESKNG